jgi:hypothetical protein
VGWRRERIRGAVVKITIEVELGNDAMLTPEDVRGAVRVALDRWVHNNTDCETGIRVHVHDANGNRVGVLTVEES